MLAVETLAPQPSSSDRHLEPAKSLLFPLLFALAFAVLRRTLSNSRVIDIISLFTTPIGRVFPHPLAVRLTVYLPILPVVDTHVWPTLLDRSVNRKPCNAT